jgi:hypothetical protein
MIWFWTVPWLDFSRLIPAYIAFCRPRDNKDSCARLVWGYLEVGEGYEMEAARKIGNARKGRTCDNLYEIHHTSLVLKILW